ncbi:HDOD domain-containing protein [Nostoc sp. CHAB 5834]|nr:HDOD domain-containing protein [Nostoc sp. CHAB 5834]
MLKREQFFETLWTRLSQQGDFPTLQCSIDRLVSTLNSESNTSTLAASVMADFSLAQRVIRLANSAMYSSFGGEVTTVSRAILVLGVDTVAHLAMGVQLLENFSGAAAKHPRATEELKRAMLSGEVARALSSTQGIQHGEEAVVCALLQQLARLLLVFYFPNEWDAIQAISRGVLDEESEACKKVVGVSLEEIAKEAALKWRLPHTISATMMRQALPLETPIGTHLDWLRAMANVASKTADLITDGAEVAEIKTLLSENAQMLGLSAEVVEQASTQIVEFQKDLNAKEPTCKLAPWLPAPGKNPNGRVLLREQLAEVQQVSKTLSVAELAPLVLESMMRSLNFENCFLMLLNPVSKRFTARVAFGTSARDKLERLTFEEGFVPDFFHFAITTRKALVLEDIKRPDIKNRVPAWYVSAFPSSRSVMLTQVFLRNKCIALVCGEWGSTVCKGGLDSEEIDLVETMTRELERCFERTAAVAA